MSRLCTDALVPEIHSFCRCIKINVVNSQKHNKQTREGYRSKKEQGSHVEDASHGQKYVDTRQLHSYPLLYEIVDFKMALQQPPL